MECRATVAAESGAGSPSSKCVAGQLRMSREVLACRGIPAGSGFATSEMRLAMISPLDAAVKAHPTVVPTAFVDDVACELSGRQEAILHHLVGFVLIVCNALESAGNEISTNKSICSASSIETGLMMQSALTKFAIKFHRRVKSLSTGLRVGSVSNVTVLRKRLLDFGARLDRFATFRRSRVDTANLLHHELEF